MRKLRLLIIFLLTALLVPTELHAEKISQEKALQIANHFFKNSVSKTSISQNLTVFRTSENLPSLETKSLNSDPYFYVISNESGNGFAIVSAQDYTKPILGYSLDTDLNKEEMPDNMENWLLFLRDQIKWAEENNITDSKSSDDLIQTLQAGTPIKYLETAKWNQSSPYNLECPQKNSKRCVTGCVATAVSEVMRYHKWPTYGNGTTKAYTCETSKINVASRNLNHQYYWDEMPLSYSSSATSTQQSAVATLMADVGAALQLDYDTDGTSGYALHDCLIDNFGYREDIYNEYRSNFYDYQWVELLKSEINQNRPIVYGGVDEGKAGGHAFVLDGYDNLNYFHVNWGWGGYGNGYFLISALNVNSYKFNNSQHVLLNFAPDNGSGTSCGEGFNLYVPGLKCSATSFTKNVPFELSVSIVNFTAKSYSGTVGIMLTDHNGNIIEHLAYISATIGSLMAGSASGFNVTITNDIKTGYRVRAFHKPSGSSTWHPMWRDGCSSNITQEILVADDVEKPLDEATSLYYNKPAKQIVISTLSAVVSTLYDDNENEVADGISRDSNVITVDLSKLTTGKYKIKLQKNEQIKELEFSVKPIN